MHRTTLRVRFSELDPYDHVNHAVYVTYFEVARTEALAAVGLALEDLKRDGLQIVVSELHVRFRSPAVAGDLLEIDSAIVEVGGAASRWQQRIVRGTGDEAKVLVEAELRAGLTDLTGRVRRMPADLVARLAPLRAAGV